jgi:putrescine aminotransferase
MTVQTGSQAGTAREVFATVRRHQSPGLALGFKMIGRGAYEVSADGARVRLSDGRQAIDLGSYAVTLLGHRHPRVVDAVVRQLDLLPTTSRCLANPTVAGLVAKLVDRCGGGYDHVWLGSDGADAVETATKLARRVTGRSRILAVDGGFHGKTLGALALTWNPVFRRGLDGVLAPSTHLDPTDPMAVARQLATGDVAAVIVEPVQGEAGVRPLEPAVLARWAADARAGGAMVISDEVQAGLRRCGPFSVALAQGWQPDALLFGKALGGGVLPLSAVVATTALFQPLIADPTWHTATFGGHPLACAAGIAALDVVEELSVVADPLGQAFGAGLRQVVARHPDLVAEVRGVGLLWG